MELTATIVEFQDTLMAVVEDQEILEAVVGEASETLTAVVEDH